MCGIAAVVDADISRAAAHVSRVNDLQSHRGPDHQVVHRIGVFTLGNTRLAIQDPGPSGNQPFISPDKRYHCVFNGEIYNYRRLIQRYRLDVQTSSDGEVITALWAKLGAAALAELRGMFVIALVDSLEERLYLVRDPFGIKPLYWRALRDGAMVFASEIRSLVSEAGLSVDSAAIARYLRYGAMAADQSPFTQVGCLPPNSMATVGPDKKMEIRPIPAVGPSAEATHDLGTALTDSIDLHLGADVPTVLLLSSGVDSAAIAAVGRAMGRDLHCLTVATSGASDESGEAAVTARHYGHSFQRVPATLDEHDVSRFFAAMQRPSIDGLNTYLVAKAVHHAGYKVALSGLGGDEAIGGYAHFRLLTYLRALCWLDAVPERLTIPVVRLLCGQSAVRSPKKARLLDRGGPRDGPGIVSLQREVLPADWVAQLSGIRGQPAVPTAGRRRPDAGQQFAAMVSAELGLYLQAMLLPDADAFSMASSVELRVPFVDTQVFAAALGLASRMRARPGKAAIGAALDDSYLVALAQRRKRGFSVPMRTWMSGPLSGLVSYAQDPDAPIWSVLDRDRAVQLGILPIRTRERWSEAWVIAALNMWLGSVEAGQAV